MPGKRTKTRKKIKLNKRLVCSISIVLLLIAVIFTIKIISKPVKVGKINKEGKAEYIERVVNVTKYPNKKIVEFKNDAISALRVINLLYFNNSMSFRTTINGFLFWIGNSLKIPRKLLITTRELTKRDKVFYKITSTVTFLHEV